MSTQFAERHDPERVVTAIEAAAMCGVSRDKIKRLCGAGAFPHSAIRPGDARGTRLIPLGDLVAAGLLDEQELAAPSELLTRSRETRQIAALLEDNHRKDQLIAAQDAHIARLEQERDWLRSMLANKAA
jgi:hypothetical protein